MGIQTQLRNAIGRGLRLSTLAVGVAASALLVAPARASAEPPASVPAQFYGSPWGGGPWWPGGFASGWGSPYAGSPDYPYYRVGPYYGSSYGLPYPVSPRPVAYPYYTETYGSSYPYPSAGGVAFSYSDDAGFYAPVGRCVYSSLAGIGGSWSDPPSYGYYAPFC
jgi:hypothetical protein